MKQDAPVGKYRYVQAAIRLFATLFYIASPTNSRAEIPVSVADSTGGYLGETCAQNE
jgi:hypothetical protein